MIFKITHASEPLAIPGFSTIIHLGAGPYLNTSLYESPNLKKTVLVDGDPDICSELRSSTSSATSFDIRNICLRPQDGPCNFYRYNYSFFNGPLSIGKLAGVYPSLKQLSELPGEGVSLANFLAEFQTQKQSMLLIFDLAGQELSLLQSVSFSLLSAFPWILLRGTAYPQQEGATGYQESKRFLQTSGYSPIATADDHDADSPLVLFHLSKESTENQRLKSECKDLSQEVLSLRADSADQKKSVDELLAQRDSARTLSATQAARIAELESQLAEQSLRQEKINEQMLKAEAQLTLLKEFLSRPSTK
jgi:hypothetical protein